MFVFYAVISSMVSLDRVSLKEKVRRRARAGVWRWGLPKLTLL